MKLGTFGISAVFLLVICAFATGWYMSSIRADKEIQKLNVKGDSLRSELKGMQEEGILEAVARMKLEQAFEKELKERDSIRAMDQATIKHFKKLIGRKLTPHELKNEMDSIFAASRAQR